MPLYMDVHNLPGATAAAVAAAHARDLEVQDEHNVNYLHYWIDEAAGKVFCLVKLPTRKPPTRSTPRRTA